MAANAIQVVREQSDEDLSQHRCTESHLNYRFLLPIGVVQLIGAALRLIVGALQGIGTGSVGLSILVAIASFLLYSATGAAILLTRLTRRMPRLKPRATGCLVLCAVSAVFTVSEINQHLHLAVAEYQQQLTAPLSLTNSSSSIAKQKRQRRLEHRTVMLLLLLVQCVTVTFAGYLCVKLIWSGSSGRRSNRVDNSPSNKADSDSATAETRF